MSHVHINFVAKCNGIYTVWCITKLEKRLYCLHMFSSHFRSIKHSKYIELLLLALSCQFILHR